MSTITVIILIAVYEIYTTHTCTYTYILYRAGSRDKRNKQPLGGPKMHRYITPSDNFVKFSIHHNFI